jgi:hypothetical protein
MCVIKKPKKKRRSRPDLGCSAVGMKEYLRTTTNDTEVLPFHTPSKETCNAREELRNYMLKEVLKRDLIFKRNYA